MEIKPIPAPESNSLYIETMEKMMDNIVNTMEIPTQQEINKAKGE